MSRNLFHNFVGSFSDAAILFPLLVLLGQKTSFHLPILFLSAGILVIVSALYFRVPMSVQPLKSIAIAAISVNATAAEIQLSTLLLSIVFFVAVSMKPERWLQLVPDSWTHTLQFSLGVLLLCQGFDVATKTDFGLLLVFALSAGLIAVTWNRDWPLLGILATFFIGFSIFSGINWSELQARPVGIQVGIPISDIRWPLVMSLLFPQLALTMANSVIATENVSKRYFGAKAKAVTSSRLMKMISVSNFLSAVFGGLPMCHGSGGVTALVKGGARDWTSNIYLGVFLLVLTTLSIFYDINNIQFPPVILGSLLSVVGFYHLILAKPTWNTTEGKLRIFVAALAVLLTRNLLIVLMSQVVFTLFMKMTFLKYGRDCK